MNLVNFFPHFVRRHIEHRPGLKKILDNIGWLVLDKILRMGVGLFVGVWFARYLGPEQFGQLNFAIVFVALFGVLAVLGLNEIVVRDLVQDPESASMTLGTAFVLQVAGGLVAVCLIVGVIIWIRPEDQFTRHIVYIISLSLIFRSAEVVKYWFESLVQSRYVVYVENSIFLAMAGLKVAMILLEAPLMVFVWMLLIEAVLAAIGLFSIYLAKGFQFRIWRFRLERAQKLLSDSWPLLLSGVAVIVYMRIDQIMLSEMIGHEAVGIYTAAVRISEVWYFVPLAIVSSVFPAIIEAKKISEESYLQRLQKLYNLMVVVALGVGVPMTFLSDQIIYLLFGDSYTGAGPVLAIHVWAGIFVGLGLASGKWYLVEGLSSCILWRAVLGALVNVGLNILLIPEYGIQGAAMATLLSYFVAGMLFDLFVHKARQTFIMKFNSLLLRWTYVQ